MNLWMDQHLFNKFPVIEHKDDSQYDTVEMTE